jgi:hypothetical protein
MADFNLERIRFRWKGEWVASTPYVKDDLVYYKGKTYVCMIGHTSNGNNLTTDLLNASPKWELMLDGWVWRGDWGVTTYYTVGDIVKFEGYLYQCITSHTSTNLINAQLPADIARWRIVATGYNWLSDWATGFYYDLGDVVRYNGIVYICSTKHLSASTTALGLEQNQASWTAVTTSDDWHVDWETSKRYRVKDIAKYGAITYRCIQGHTSAATNVLGLEADQAKWEIFLEGIEYKGNWSNNFRYKRFDIVKSGGALWRSLTGHTSTTTLRVDQSNWEIWVPGLNYEFQWVAGANYNQGDIVYYGGYSYTALTNNTNSVPSVNGLLQDIGDWELLTQGYRHRGSWNQSFEYYTGDIVRDQGYLYIATGDNTGINPDSDANRWQVLVTGRKWKKAWQDNVEYHLGDVVTYAGTLYICVIRHQGTESDNRPDLDIENTNNNYWILLAQGTSSNVLTTDGDIRTHDATSTVRLPIGLKGAALKIHGQFPEWQQFDAVPLVFYVAPSGINDPTVGTSSSAPFRTVKYACQHIANNFRILKFNDINYETINPALVDTTMLGTALQILGSGGTLTNAPQFEIFLENTNPRTGRAYADLDGNGITAAADALIAINTALGVANSLTAEVLAYKDIVDYVNDNSSTFSSETVTNENIPGTPIVMHVVKSTYPNTSVFIKTGIYEEELPIKIPRNCALIGDELRSTVIMPAAGFEQSNMFFVNNGSGMRNMTLQGLSGTLPPGGNEYGTRLPTAGAFVSLDPGTGPQDEDVWIITRSPYIQNITTFGTACIGMKIDGTLHSFGNKSVTANDFTQVLDDGIGYWANEAGRSELVSVFTYFNYIGYYSTSGGILRATNGNNSYGTFGSRAEGFSLSETPITAQVNNRSKEAQVDIVHTDGTELVALGFSHAGQEYSTAIATVSGTGINADIRYEEFRNNAISQLRIIDPADSSTPGGLNYQYFLNSAQQGDENTITLSAADTVGTPARYVGMRIVIVSGAGVGQYGIITDYNETTKIAVISKEYNGSNGWENLYPGRPIDPVLDSTTRYSIEPRVIVDDPGFVPTVDNSVVWPNGFTNTSVRSILKLQDRWIATNGAGDAATSTDGETFVINQTNLTGALGGAPVGGIGLSTTTADNAYFVAATENAVLKYTYSNNSWASIALPTLTTGVWNGIATDGSNIMVSSDNQAVTINSVGTIISTISTGETFRSVAYGNSKFVLIQINGTVVTYDPVGDVTQTYVDALGSIDTTWNAVAYGNGRFVAVGTNLTQPDASSASGAPETRYSFDSITWYDNDTNVKLLPNGELRHIVYNNGEFVAFTNRSSATNYAIKTKDGWAWQWFDEGSTAYTVAHIGTGCLGYDDTDIMIIQTDGSSTVNRYRTGAGAVIRATVSSSRIQSFIVYDPGANYQNIPGVLVFDPDVTVDVLADARMASGVLAQPTFVNRGSGYVNATATISGNGFADIYQTGKTIVLKNVSLIPGVGANVVFNGIDDIIYRLTKINSQSGTAPNYDLVLDISPPIKNQNSPDHEETLIMRELYSQIRLTGHDFLDIGSGNVNSTRYPDLYLEGYEAENEPQPFNEVTEFGGGRVFYTSTDQDGNFRVGELFAVEQATGIVSINADFFELSGLNELSLGAIQLGGTAVVIREFSKEPTFGANSNNIVPTQRAIATYLASRISGGGADAVTNALIAGQVRVSGNNITTTSGLPINVPVTVNMAKGVDGDYLALMFFKSKK